MDGNCLNDSDSLTYLHTSILVMISHLKIFTKKKICKGSFIYTCKRSTLPASLKKTFQISTLPSHSCESSIFMAFFLPIFQIIPLAQIYFMLIVSCFYPSCLFIRKITKLAFDVLCSQVKAFLRKSHYQTIHELLPLFLLKVT